jgi:Rad3-related DNA helicase
VSSVIIPRLLNVITDSIEQAKETRSKKKKAEFARKADHCDKAMCKYNRFIKDEDNFSRNWVFEKDLDKNGKTKILVEPIWANIYLKKMFWNLYDHVIFMSGTILNPEMMSFLMGLEKEDSSYLALPCPFDAEKRPIIYAKFGKMSYHEKADTFRIAVPIIERILEKNKGNKGIIHSGNYQFNEWIKKAINDERLLIHSSSDREDTLKHHLRSEDNTVLVSPSMMTGIDLKDDLSRFQIILKVPFPHLGSTKIRKRLETNSEWYNWKTLIEIVQSYGRSIRNEDDWAETYILDSCFDQVLGNQLPEYFRQAIRVKRIK